MKKLIIFWLVVVMLFAAGCVGPAIGVTDDWKQDDVEHVGDYRVGNIEDIVDGRGGENTVAAGLADPLTVLYIPLDNRPINYENVLSLAKIAGVQLLTPPSAILGSAGENGGLDGPGDQDAVMKWLAQNGGQADVWVISLDMLLYGGLAPSRSHERSRQEILRDMQFLQSLLAGINRDIPVYAFATVMRSAASSASPKQPGYFSDYGDHILSLSKLWDLADRQEASAEKQAELERVKSAIPSEVLNNYLQRRETNLTATRQAVHLTAGGLIDYLVLGRDDTTPYSFSRVDLRSLEEDIRQRGLANRIDSYPGADELGALLLARAVYEALNRQPRVYVDWATPQGPGITALYEDVTLEENVRLHVKSSGGQVVESPEEADLVLVVNSPVDKTVEAAVQPADETPGRHHRAVADRIGDWLAQGKPVAVADVAYANGGDRAFMETMAGYTSSASSDSSAAYNESSTGPLFQLAGYAGCNTAGNTIGMSLAHGLIYSTATKSTAPLLPFPQGVAEDHSMADASNQREAKGTSTNVLYVVYEEGVEGAHQEYLRTRILEDWGFQSVVRPAIIKTGNSGATTAGTALDRATATQLEQQITNQLNKFLKNYLTPTFGVETRVTSVTLPWNRLFDISFTMEHYQK